MPLLSYVNSIVGEKWRLNTEWAKDENNVSEFVNSTKVVGEIDHVHPRRGPRGLPSPMIFKILGGMKAPLVPFHSWDLGVHGASIAQMCLSCLVDLNLIDVAFIIS